jgi:hypothetical protein
MTGLGVGLQAACAAGGLSPSRRYAFAGSDCDVDSHSALVQKFSLVTGGGWVPLEEWEQ